MTSGLEGVVAAETVLSHVDGENGRLIIRGRELDDIAGKISFEEVCALLWEGLAEPDLPEKDLREVLGTARVAVWPLAQKVFTLCRETPALSLIEGLRLGLSALSDQDKLPHHLLVTAMVPVMTAGLIRIRKGQEPVAPDEALSHAADFLAMMTARPPKRLQAHALDTYLSAVCDHGLNASTFTARVIASTQAGMISSVIGGLCALKGPLHGGAPGPVLDMLDEIGDEKGIRPWLERQLDQGERLMGFGHRIYKVRDPRADVLKGAVRLLSGDDNNRIALAEKVEQVALEVLAERKPGRRLETNVEFYTALLLEALSIPREAFTPVFAIGRTAGWVAHVLEQEKVGRIIRPSSVYIGPEPLAA